ncbi:enoyl-CoA hydratase [Pseudomonas sp. BN102]|uniref:enoyl-CoA hydratase n=1 Tax=Pseudomonas sp. BN102 TaxID=2567886 RepID=UPI0024576189|nr:enoyl-CoA hydratase [Pseudomonas sp. BN102]MDH4608758.1 enoyl-CoA hydratase [Pseudomonas sp. BN102]
MTYQTLLVEQAGAVGLITLNRPEALNAINTQLIDELNQALDGFERDPAIGCVLITGSAKAFAAGADVKEMAEKCFPDTYLDDFLGRWDRVAQRRKPIIAAVAGHALGGGFELALMCDFIIAADNARFGLPEVKLGVIPGSGGTQRLTRLVGRAKAMEMLLTGRTMDAAEAERCGVVARVVPVAELLEEAMDSASRIAAQSRTAVLMLKECVNRVDEGSLGEGLRFERRLFQAVFATPDQKEGMGAFIEKRKPEFGR